MEDITSAISKLLENPESVSLIKNMAQSVMGQNENTEKEELLPSDMSKIIKIVSTLKTSSADDNNTRLLMSLKPYVSKNKQEKIDEAVKIMKIVALLPLIKDIGIL